MSITEAEVWARIEAKLDEALAARGTEREDKPARLDTYTVHTIVRRIVTDALDNSNGTEWHGDHYWPTTLTTGPDGKLRFDIDDDTCGTIATVTLTIETP